MLKYILLLILPLLLTAQGKATHGNSLLFGTSAYIIVTDNLANEFDSVSFSVAFWLKFTTPLANQSLIFRRLAVAPKVGFWSYCLTDGRVVFYVMDSASLNPNLTSTNIYGNTGWHYFVFTFNRADSARLFVDGTQDIVRMYVAGLGRMNTGGINWTIGYFGGNMVHFRFYRRALALSEIQWLYRNPTVIYNTDSLRIWLPMNEYTGTIAGDSSGNGNSGTITSGTWSIDTPVKSGGN